MKERYLEPEMETVEFSVKDVISTSVETTTEWVPRENEGAPTAWDDGNGTIAFG